MRTLEAHGDGNFDTAPSVATGVITEFDAAADGIRLDAAASTRR